MALTYEESAALIDNMVFRSRTKIACLHYATYITDEPANTPAHSTRIKWAQQTLIAPDVAVMNIMPTLVMDDQVQLDGVAITDAALQLATERSINKLL